MNAFSFVRVARLVAIATFVSGVVSRSLVAADADGSVQFNRDVRPIFSRHCTKCHVGEKPAGDVSFAFREKALTTVEPGQPQKSELIRRVRSKDPELVMPKPEHGPPLSEREISTLERWIEQGATWSEPWSFVRPVDRPPPSVKQSMWPIAKLDHFILARLEAERLAPAPPAAPHEWLRRVTLNLTGVPPTVEQWEKFAAELATNPTLAREHVVDRLLDSPQFGERWAAVWLDLARYSDTYGYEKDPHREIWPWRDWVIRAFNADLPFDQFTIKQLAGDLLENPQPDDLLATAFHRNTQCNTEGGTDDEEYRVAAVIDRVNTTWTVWQATTFGCVRCHAHPYDPFPQTDYYRFLALFNNSEDCDQNDDFPRTKVTADAQQQAEAVRLERQQRSQRQALNEAGLQLAAQVTDWQPLIPTELKSSGGALTSVGEGRITAGGTLPIGVFYTLTYPAQPLTALRLSLAPDSDDPTKWPERGAVLSKIEVTLVAADGQRTPIKLKEVIADTLGGPFDPQDSLTDSDGGFGDYPVLRGPHWAVIVLEQPLAPPVAEGNTPGAKLEVVLRQKAASNSGFQACTLRNFTIARSVDPRWITWTQNAERQRAWQQWQRDRDAWKAIPGPLVPMMQERHRAAQRETRLFVRGNFLVHGPVVEPGLPEVFAPPSVEKGRAMNRLDLARWLVSENNALTARVMANRLWAELFGRGIVETQEDFGSSGVAPTHPELLDHLALRFARDHRWSVKKFLRELALSATFAQSAHLTPALLEKDPNNLLYARGPRARLTAEMVRDQALSAAGLLSAKQFGPPVYPPQPPGIWNTVYSGAEWKTSTGEDRYRRAIYTYCKRTSGYPELLTFDAPTRDVCTARRVPTNTPLQALVTLNDPAFFEMAQALAQRMEKAGGTPSERITWGYRRIALVPPSLESLQTLLELYEQSLAECRANAETSAKLANTPEAAALVLVANTLLNLDAALVR